MLKLVVWKERLLTFRAKKLQGPKADHISDGCTNKPGAEAEVSTAVAPDDSAESGAKKKVKKEDEPKKSAKS